MAGERKRLIRLLGRQGPPRARLRPLFTTDKAMQDCLPYYLELFEEVQAAGLDPATA
jgi:hypothetical protein